MNQETIIRAKEIVFERMKDIVNTDPVFYQCLGIIISALPVADTEPTAKVSDTTKAEKSSERLPE
jgi:hypothetical protein